MFEVSIKTEFAAAHNLTNYSGACETLHGHNWKVEIRVESSELDKSGLAIDFLELKRIANEAMSTLDHTNINEHPAFVSLSPSSENIARFIYGEVKKALPAHGRLKKVTIWETDDASASYMES